MRIAARNGARPARQGDHPFPAPHPSTSCIRHSRALPVVEGFRRESWRTPSRTAQAMNTTGGRPCLSMAITTGRLPPQPVTNRRQTQVAGALQSTDRTPTTTLQLSRTTCVKPLTAGILLLCLLCDAPRQRRSRHSPVTSGQSPECWHCLTQRSATGVNRGKPATGSHSRTPTPRPDRPPPTAPSGPEIE